MRYVAWGAVSWTAGRVSPVGVLQWAVVSFLGAATVFLVSPEIDIAAAGLFHGPGQQFVGRTASVEMIRDIFKGIYVVSLAAAIAAIWFSHRRRTKVLRLGTQRWIVVVLTLIVGPGLVANVMLKDQMGRARPAQTETFGGTATFTPALVPASECKKNCSFVSGEASSMFALFFGLAMVAGPMARRYFIAGLLAGGVAGLIRMSQGAHFLSDVIFAGIFMAITAALIRILVIDVRRSLRQRTAAGQLADPA